MIKSMTGYGSAKGNAAGFEISVELKSVNNRYLETSVRMPRSFLFAEEAVKSTVQQHISRGKVDVFINVSAVGVDDVKVSVNESLLKGYVEAVRKIAEEYQLSCDLTAMGAARFPDVLSVERNELDAEAVSAGICSVLEIALNDFDAMRLREGEKLRDDVLARLGTIDAYVSRVEEEAPQTVQRYRERLERKMAEVLGSAGIEEDRILAEAAIFADHIAVDEETVRLRSHLAQLHEMLAKGGAIGRKLDFLIQEFNREANTIGSKCSDVEMAKLVVEIKGEIEKIREQVQNIE